MKNIVLTILLSALVSVANAEYRGVIEYGLSGVENHDVTSSPRIGLQYNSQGWESEISWQHWFTNDGNLSDKNVESSGRSYYGNNLFSLDYRKILFGSRKFVYSIGSGLSAIEMKSIDINQKEVFDSYRTLLNISATISYKLTRAVNLRLSALTSLEMQSQLSPVFGSLNLGVNSRF